MSLLTNFLGLFKWDLDDETDLNNKFDIEKSLNNNWDKLDEKINEINTSVNNNNEIIEKQEDLIDKLIENSIQESTEEATSIYITDASSLPSQLNIKGNQNQEVTETAENIFSGELESGAWDYTSGEKIDNSSYMRSVDYINVSGQTQISVIKKDGGIFTCGLRYYDADKNYIGRSSINNVTDAITTTIVNNLDDSKTVKYATITFTHSTDTSEIFGINKGEDLEWHDFIPNSPSPDYPSEIRGLEEVVEVTVANKNIAKFDKTHNTVTKNGVTITVDENGVFTLNGTVTSSFYLNCVDITESGDKTHAFRKGTYKTYFELIEKNSSTVSSSNDDIHFYFRNIATNHTEKTPVTYDYFNLIISTGEGIRAHNMTVSEDTMTIYMFVNSGVFLDNLKFRYAIFSEKEADTTYVTHEETEYTLPIQETMLSRDYFIKEDGSWKEVHTWKKYTFTGDESFYISTKEDFYRYSLQFSDAINESVYSTALSNCYSSNDIDTLRETLCYMYEQYVYLYSKETSIADFQNVLKEKYEEGNPVYIYYELAEPEKLDCTEEQIKVLDELEKLELFKGTNNIFTFEDIALLQLDYIGNIKEYIDNKLGSKLGSEE